MKNDDRTIMVQLLANQLAIMTALTESDWNLSEKTIDGLKSFRVTTAALLRICAEEEKEVNQ